MFSGTWREDLSIGVQTIYSVRVEEIEDVNKMKMGLYVTHTMNFQNYEEKSNRRSELVFELKKMFEELGINHQ